ncbi:MAG: OmpA family protein [Taibaiella sp.]|nr:OmpA family protein [Taibaiella sp.]
MKRISIIFSAALLFTMASCSDTKTSDTTGSADTAVLKKDSEVTVTEKEVTNWDKVDFTSPIVKYDEISSADIDVRGNEMYSIYGLGEDVLFTTGKADVRPEAKIPLEQVCASLAAHYPNGNIRVYGYTDATGTAGDNKELSAQRAMAVKNYLVNNCNIADSRISTVAEGEATPVASNENAKGRQQNRRVRIVAMK